VERPPIAWCGLSVALAVLACNEDGPSADDLPADDLPNPVCSGDYSQRSTAPVSLEHDLMPIFAASCVFSSCHDPSARKADLVLGDPKSFGLDAGSCIDESAEWGCRLSEPIDPALLKEVRDGLLAPSKTVKVPALPRVTPGDPTKSFLLDKVTGTQNRRGYAQCENQSVSGSSANTCGDTMPLGSTTYCATMPEKVIAIVQWIRDGAPEN
jgi:hypothetical protein